jgi:hypothetical protein
VCTSASIGQKLTLIRQNQPVSHTNLFQNPRGANQEDSSKTQFLLVVRPLLWKSFVRPKGVVFMALSPQIPEPSNRPNRGCLHASVRQKSLHFATSTMPLPVSSSARCHRVDEQVVLALKMPVEAPFFRPTFFITVPMPLPSPPRSRKERAATERIFSWFAALCSREYRITMRVRPSSNPVKGP